MAGNPWAAKSRGVIPVRPDIPIWRGPAGRVAAEVSPSAVKVIHMGKAQFAGVRNS